MTVSMQLMIADFNTLDGAKNAFKRVKQDKLKRGDVALLTKDENNKIKFKEIYGRNLGDSLKRGAAAVLIGAPLGVLTTPVAGAVTGVLLADKFVDTGFPDDKLKSMAESLQPSHSMLVMITDLESAPAVKEILYELGGDLINYPLSIDLVNELKKAMESDEIKLDVAVNEDV
ncbi:MAG: DUF1269 domain-containing protein [Synechococcus sp.]